MYAPNKKGIQDEIDEKLERGNIDDFISQLRRGICDPRISPDPYAILFDEPSYTYMEKHRDAPTFVFAGHGPESGYCRGLDRSIVENLINLGLPLKPLVVYAPNETDFFALAKIIEDSIEIKPTSIVIPLGNVIDKSGKFTNDDVEKALKKASSEKIDLIFISKPIRKLKSIKSITSDNFEAGVYQAKEICDRIGGKGLVIVVRGIKSAAGLERIQGMKSVFKNYPKVDIYEIDEEEWVGKDYHPMTTYDIMVEHLDTILKKIEMVGEKLKNEKQVSLDKVNETKKSKYKPLVAVAAINDAMGEGAARFFSELYDVEPTKLSKLCPIISNDLTVRGKYLVDKGVLAGTVDLFIKYKGKLIANTCVKKYYGQTNYPFVDIIKPRVYRASS